MSGTECRGAMGSMLGGESEVSEGGRGRSHHAADDHPTRYKEELMNVGSGVGPD